MKIILFKDKWGGVTTFDVTDEFYERGEAIQGFNEPTEALLDFIFKETGKMFYSTCDLEAFWIDTENLGGDLIYGK